MRPNEKGVSPFVDSSGWIYQMFHVSCIGAYMVLATGGALRCVYYVSTCMAGII